MKKFSAILLAVITCFSFVSCKDKNDSSSGGDSGDIVDSTVKKYTYDGTHIFTATERTDYLVQNGHTAYKVLIPETSDAYLSMAKNELISLFKQATGIDLECVTESGNGLEHTVGGKYISLGDTKMFQSARIELNRRELTRDGVRIVTKDNTIYVNGGGTLGSLYGVYDLLKILFNFESYAADCWYIDENVKDIKMRDFDVTDIPDVKNRANLWGGVVKNENNFAFRVRTPSGISGQLPVGDLNYVDINGKIQAGSRESVHNMLNVLPMDAATSEEKWFSINGKNVCFTARGDEESYRRMIAQTAKVVEQSMMDYSPKEFPQYTWFTLTIEDGSNNCSCEGCGAAVAKYGALSGAAIVFCNDVMELVTEWMDSEAGKEYAREDFLCAFFAYHEYVEAPSHYDETLGKYVVNHEDLIMRDDVVPYFAISPGFQNYENIYNDINSDAREMCRGWFDISDKIYIWTYNANFFSYLSFRNTFPFYTSDAYQFFASGDILGWTQNAIYDSNNFTCFQGLSAYLDAKHMWQANLDTDELIESWFNAMFKEAAPLMKELYMQEAAHDVYLIREVHEKYFQSAVDYATNDAKYWPLHLLYGWLDILDEANELIEMKYKLSDPATYEILKNHLDMEWVGPAYQLVSNYDETTADKERIAEVKNYFKTVIIHKPAYKTSEHGEMLTDFINRL